MTNRTGGRTSWTSSVLHKHDPLASPMGKISTRRRVKKLDVEALSVTSSR